MSKCGHFIDGEWTAEGGEFFHAFDPAGDKPLPEKFASGDAQDVDRAVDAARASFEYYASFSEEARGNFLRAIANEMEKRGDEITVVAGKETALPKARLEGERARTTGQLRMFAELIEAKAHLDIRKDKALPERKPMPRPDLRHMQRPLGPVGVFGACNFPLAFSTAGGDTAAALAAGCPVIVKSHPSHPGTSAIVAEAVGAAMRDYDIPPGVFSLIQGNKPELSQALTAHSGVKAVGFTGSLKVGRALFDIACRRPAPIPFYAEMGSINPMFILSGAAKENIAAIGAGWGQSLTLGGGQFCTNPGVVFCPAAAAAEFIAAAEAMDKAHLMLSPAVADSYRQSLSAMEKRAKKVIGNGENDGEHRGKKCLVGAAVMRCDIEQWLSDSALREEIFGPAGIVVCYEDGRQLQQAAREMDGQLTATLWLSGNSDNSDTELLLPILEDKAGRLICNGFPTGVEVAEAMMHGGPYPAATYPATSVGALAIRRFLRPICLQNFPADLLPSALQ